MNNYMIQLWNNQLTNNFPFTIPMYNGENHKSQDYNLDEIFSGMALIKNNLESDITELVDRYIESHQLNGYRIVKNSLEFKEVNTPLDSFIRVYLDYDLVNDQDVKMDHYRINIVSFPKVQKDYTFLINGSRFSFIDELVNDYTLTVRDTPDYRDVSVQSNKLNYVFRKYFDGSCVLVIKEFKKLIMSSYIDDMNSHDLDENGVKSIIPELRKFIDDIEISDDIDSLELVKLIFDNINNPKYFSQDDIKSKRVISGYHQLKKVVSESIRYNFNATRKYGGNKLKSVKYSAITSKLHSSPTMSYISDLNPIAFLSSMRKMDKNGPSGPKRTNLSMRDYHHSEVGYVDPLETPESGKLGLVVHRASGAYYDKHGKFHKVKSITENYSGLNFAALSIPFIQNNDSIRDSMACSHTKQASPILNNEVPNVSTGIDRVLYDTLGDNIKSPYNGQVIAVTEGGIKVMTDAEELKFISIPAPELYNDKVIHRLYPSVKAGDAITEGQYVTSSSSYKDGYMTLGRNVRIAWMPYKGLNYEDSVIISKSLSETLVSDKGYKLNYSHEDKFIEEEFIPTIGDVVNKGDVVLRYKKTLNRPYLSDLYASDDSVITYKKSGTVVDVILMDKNNSIVEPGSHTKVVIIIASPHVAEKGDKLSFSSAAKCIISEVLDDDLMPRTHDGHPIDIIHNTIGIPSRMNLSQLMEASLSYLNELIKSELLSKISDKDGLTELFTKINSVVNVEYINQFIEFFNGLSDIEFSKLLTSMKSRFVFEVKSFDKSITKELITELYQVLELDHIYNPHEGKKLFLPEFGKLTKTPVFYGFMRILTLKHLVDEKISAVSIGGISDCREKKQKVGEMEILGLEAHGAAHMINELALIRSNKSVRQRVFKDIFNSKQNDSLLNINAYTAENSSYDEFKKVLRGMGIKIEDNK
ncbi:RNA polymerase beta subunit [Yersinia phage YerA41]|nr:RNA polymerase beta subunit [Yersinia phage YerA41]